MKNGNKAKAQSSSIKCQQNRCSTDSHKVGLGGSLPPAGTTDD
jgi:hypothetical protein